MYTRRNTSYKSDKILLISGGRSGSHVMQECINVPQGLRGSSEVRIIGLDMAIQKGQHDKPSHLPLKRSSTYMPRWQSQQTWYNDKIYTKAFT